MKSIIIPIEVYEQSQFFVPIREKSDYIRVLLSSIKSLILYNDLKTLYTNQNDYYFTITIDRMKRIIFVSPTKIFSLSFPFNIYENQEGSYTLFTMKGHEFNSKSISELLSIVNDESYKSNNSIVDFCLLNNVADNLTEMFEELLLSEPGYIRYDYDDSDRQNPDYHPLNHLDINYSNYCSLKIGLTKRIDHDIVKDLLDNSKKRHYIHNI